MWHPSNPRPDQGRGRILTIILLRRRSAAASSAGWVQPGSTLGCSLLRRVMATSSWLAAAVGTSSRTARRSRWLRWWTGPNRRRRSPSTRPASAAGESGDTPSTRAKGTRGGCCPADADADANANADGAAPPAPPASSPGSTSSGRPIRSNRRSSPCSTPATVPSQFCTAHLPVLGSNLGWGLGAARLRRSSSSAAAASRLPKAATWTMPASTRFMRSLWSVRTSLRRCRSVRARNTSTSPRG
mmetsp:Transcript_4655/g.13163  ORF Transcript_4655/g.13163 Transcript_4655/m.13163 type:complete len:243 (+) Transcript_4655:1073-1801(+)